MTMPSLARSVSLVMGVLWLATGAWGQGQPVPPGEPVIPPSQSATMRAPTLADYSSYTLPAWAREVAVARVRAGAAQESVARAQAMVNGTLSRLRNVYENSEEMRAARAALKAAQQEYEAARERVLEVVSQDPEWKAARAEQEGPARVLAAGSLSPADRLQAATLKLQLASVAHRIEMEALDADTAVKEARAKLIAANRRLSELREAAENAIAASPEYAAARENLERARATLVEAYSVLAGAEAGLAAVADQTYYDRYYQSRYSPEYWGTIPTGQYPYRW